jgi:TerC family integral membrane protein
MQNTNLTAALLSKQLMRCCRISQPFWAAVLIFTWLIGPTRAQSVFVSSRNSHTIKHYDLATGNYLGDFVAQGSGGLSFPQEVLWHPDGFLLVTGIKMLVLKGEMHPEENPLVLWLKKHLPFSDQYDRDRFLTRIDGKRFFTPLFLVLVLVEFTDLVFAVDSIPAIFAVTRDPFIVYTSNVFAILGLRSLYFALAGLVDKFRYLKTGLAVVLMFVGIKMLIVDFYKVPVALSLGVILGILSTAVVASLWRRA